MHVYPADALYADRTQEPTGGVPSMSDAEIVRAYNWWLNRPPDGSELESERGNALKYSAAGIERQIAMRSGNVASSGTRGDEGLAPLTKPAPIYDSHVGSIITSGPSAIGPYNGVQGGPIGLMSPGQAYYPNTFYGAATQPAGLSMTTILIGAAVLAGAWFLWKGGR
jgi:hypothetical protein